MPQPSAATAKRFLIVRLSAIGDTIHTLPLAAALKRLHPGCFLGWIVEKPAAPLIEANPLVDWVHVLPKGWLKSLAQIARLRREAHAQHFEIAFDVQGLSKSAVAAWLSGAPIRVGFARGEAREIAPLLDNRLATPRGVHVVDKVLSLLSAINAKPPDRPEFVFPPCSPADKASIEACIRDKPLTCGYCLMGPWGSFAAKRWPLERFLELAERLGRDSALPSLILGHGRERDAVTAALAEHPGAPAFLAPDVSPAGVVELARRARLFVGCDSFPMHAASGVGCPTVGLFGVTDPERLGPYGDHGRSVFARLTLLKSTRERRRLDQSNMLALEADTVAKACRECLKTLG